MLVVFQMIDDYVKVLPSVKSDWTSTATIACDTALNLLTSAHSMTKNDQTLKAEVFSEEHRNIDLKSLFCSVPTSLAVASVCCQTVLAQICHSYGRKFLLPFLSKMTRMPVTMTRRAMQLMFKTLVLSTALCHWSSDSRKLTKQRMKSYSLCGLFHKLFMLLQKLSPLLSPANNGLV